MPLAKLALFHEGIWDVSTLSDGNKLSGLELRAEIGSGYHATITCMKKTHRQRARVTFYFVAPNGIRAHPSMPYEIINTDPANSTVLNYAASFMQSLRREMEQGPSYFLKRHLLDNRGSN